MPANTLTLSTFPVKALIILIVALSPAMHSKGVPLSVFTHAKLQLITSFYFMSGYQLQILNVVQILVVGYKLGKTLTSSSLMH